MKGMVVIRSPSPQLVPFKLHRFGKQRRQNHRVWRKLHLAVNPVIDDIVAAEVSLKNVHDAEMFPTLLNLMQSKLGTINAIVN
ncbi:hypothetical protein CK911_01275 [Aeromonas sp. CU5]|nr:hypothetical protein CK911_01275 [Aeromonas sp. CU5]